MTSAAWQLGRAYSQLIVNQPFYATVLLSLRRVEDPTQPTMWTDGTNLGYNPDFVMRISLDELKGVLAHEAAHVAGLHPWRRGRRDPEQWNIACDKVVNHYVEQSGLRLPAGVIPGVGGKSPEELYEDPPPKSSKPQGTQGAGGSPDNTNIGAVRDPTDENGKPLGKAELHRQMEERKIVVQQAINAGKRAGSLPADFERYVQDALAPRVDWRAILSQFIDGFNKNDYSWARPNRRYIGSGVIFPGLYNPTFGTVVCGVDTSGSINQEALRTIVGALIECLEVYEEQGKPVELPVLWCDTRVYEQLISDASELKPRGGGGTSFAPVFKRVQELTPLAVVYITDGHCSQFGEEPSCPVLWMLTQKNDSFQPPFGEVVLVLEDL